MKTMSVLLLGFLVSVTALVAGGFKMYGTLESKDSAGKTAYIHLLKEGEANLNAKPLYRTSVVLNSKGKADFSLTGIPEGSYAAVIFIDLDGNKTISKGDRYGYNTSAEEGSGDIPFMISDMEFTMASGDWYVFNGTFLINNR